MPRPFFPLLLASLLSGCYSTTPVYYSDGTGPAGSVTYINPSWETSINPIGWGLVVVATAGGAYAGYESGLEFEWETGAPKSEKPEANAAIAGVSAGLSTMILNSIFKPDAPVYRTELAEEWLDDFDENLALIGASKRSGNEYVDAIDWAWERTALPSDVTELKMFLSAFPGSTRTDEVERHAVATFSRAQLPGLAAALTIPHYADTARRRYIREATTFEDALSTVKTYPDLASVSETRTFELANGRQDVLRFVNRFPESDRISALVDREMEKLGLSELQTLLPSVHDPDVQNKIGRRFLEKATSLHAVIDVGTKFSGLSDEVERKGAEMAVSAGDYRLFLATWPESSEAAGIREKLMEKLRVPESLGNGVNTYYSELGPVIAPDGNTIYFVRRDDPDNMGWLDADDILRSTRTKLDTWAEAVRLSPPINDDQVNTIATITPDNNLMLLFGGYGGSDAPVSLAHRTADGWSDPIGQRISDYYNLNRYNEFSLSPSANVLIMSIQRRDTRGDKDLYVSFKTGENSWSRPKNLGTVLNGRGTEMSPFIAGDNRTLYFGSERAGGHGDGDIWMTRRLDDSWTKWSKPVNLGAPINGPGWDAYFSVPASGDYAYLVSSRSGDGDADIFRVALPDDRRPLPVVLVAGIVRDRSTGEPIEATIVYENLSTGAEVGRARTDPATGEYKIALPPGERYGFRAEGAGFLSISDNLDLSDLRAYREQTRHLEVAPIRSGEKVRLNNLFFDVGGSKLHPDSYPELRRLAETMTQHPTMKIEVVGHTDSIGTAADNLTLSLARASAVTDELRRLGVPSARLSVVGRGEEDPIASNGSEEGRAENRRVEVRVE